MLVAVPSRRGIDSNLSGPRLFVEVPLYSRTAIIAWTKVDIDDVPLLGPWRWSLDRDGYARRGESGSLARLILGLSKGDGLIADHINRDKLDNRRANLRAVRPAESSQNLPSMGGSSRHRGVRLHRRPNRADRWVAQAQLRGRSVHIGSFGTEEEAAAAARRWRSEHMPFATELE